MNVIQGISLFQMFLLTIAQDASSDSKAEIKLFYDAVCLTREKYDDVRKCDEIMDSGMRKGVKQCFDEILPGTLDDSKEPFSCVLFKSLLDTTDKATEEKFEKCTDDKEAEILAEKKKVDPNANMDHDDDKYFWCLTTVADREGWLGLCGKEADDALLAKINDCEKDKLIIKEKIEPCLTSAEIKRPKICSLMDPTEPAVFNCTNPEKMEKEEYDKNLDEITECLVGLAKSK